VTKKFAIVLLFAVALLAACGTATDEAVENEPATPTTLAESTTTTADALSQTWGATVDLGDLLITVAPPVDDTANLDEITREMTLEPGEKVMYCMVTIENTGDEAFAYNSMGFTLYDSEGIECDSLMAMSSQPAFGSGDLLPGRKVKGAISAIIPESASIAYVNFQRSIIDDTEASWGD